MSASPTQLNPVTNSWQNITIDRAATDIQVKNYTRYDLYIAFGSSAAPAFMPPSTQAQGHAFPGEYPVLPIQSRAQSVAERALNTIAAFDGNVWIYAIDNSGVLASNGTISNRNTIVIISYLATDPVPSSGTSMALAIDSASQQRNVSVPTSEQPTTFSGWDGTSDLSVYQIAIPPNNAANQVAYLYMYAFWAALDTQGASSLLSFEVRAQAYDSVHATVTQTVALGRFRLEANSTSQIPIPVNFCPIVACRAVLALSVGTPDTLRFVLHKVSSSGTIGVEGTAILGFDTHNNGFPGSIGVNGSASVVGPTSNPLIF